MKTVHLAAYATISISNHSDGNMRIFAGLDEQTIIANQAKHATTLGLDASRLARLHVDYAGRDNFTVYQEITQDNLAPYSIEKPEAQIPLADGLVTKDPNIGFLLPLADCLGIVVLDEAQQILGLVHSGRHNVEQFGPQKFIEFFIANFNSHPQNLKVYLSPCAQNYEIYALNHQKLPEAAKSQLITAGVLPENIIESGIDTVTNPDYPSNSTGDHNLRFAIAARLSS